MRKFHKIHRTLKTAPRRMSPHLAAMFVVAVGVTACSDSGTVTSEAKLQQAPTPASEVVAIIPRGGTVKVGDCSKGWCRVSFSGRDGYVLAKSVRLSERALRSTPEEDAPRGEDDNDEIDNAPADEPAPRSSAN